MPGARSADWRADGPGLRERFSWVGSRRSLGAILVNQGRILELGRRERFSSIKRATTVRADVGNDSRRPERLVFGNDSRRRSHGGSHVYGLAGLLLSLSLS